jgi:hypothetical protein
MAMFNNQMVNHAYMGNLPHMDDLALFNLL